MGKNEKDDLDIYMILNQIVNEFDHISKFNHGQLELNKLVLERFNTLEKKIDWLEEKIKAVEKLAMI